MKILIIRLSAIGDTIHCLPVAASLKQNIPGCQITWLVEAAGAPLLQGNPAVDKVMVLPKDKWLESLRYPWQWPQTGAAVCSFVTGLRSAGFDLVLEMQGLFKSGILAGATAAPWRVGFAHSREGAEQFLTDRVDKGDYFAFNRHIVELNLSIVDYILCKLNAVGTAATGNLAVEFPLPAPGAESCRKIDQALAGGKADSGKENISMVRNVVLIPGTTWPSKIWDWQSWAGLAELLGNNMGVRIIAVGSNFERSTNGSIIAFLRRQCPQVEVLDLTGKTNLLDLIYLFTRSHLVLGADTGPLHLAAATGKPKIVGIYGSTPVGRNGPYGAQCTTVSLGLWCQPCFKKVCPLSTTACLKDLTPQHVFSKIRNFLDN